MFVTSFTTASAFIATSFSEVMPVSAFGYFAATLILANYFLVILMFPSVLAIREKIIKSSWYQRRCGSIKCCKKKKLSRRANPTKDVSNMRSSAGAINVQDIVIAP